MEGRAAPASPVSSRRKQAAHLSGNSFSKCCLTQLRAEWHFFSGENRRPTPGVCVAGVSGRPTADSGRKQGHRERGLYPSHREETEPEMLSNLLRSHSGLGPEVGPGGVSLPISGSLTGAQVLPRKHHHHPLQYTTATAGAWDGGAKMPLRSDCGCQGTSQEEPEYRAS